MQQTHELFPRYMAHQLRTNMAVTIVGKLTEVNTKRHSIMLETDSEAKLAVQGLLGNGDDPQHFSLGRYYQIRGICRGNREVETQGWACFGADFDLNSYNQMLNLATKQFRGIFYT